MTADDILSLLLLRSWPVSERVALSLFDGTGYVETTYDELRRGALRLSNRLMALGLRQADRAAILSESRPEWVVALLGCARAGVTVVPLDPKGTSAELDQIVRDAAPRLLFASSGLAGGAARLEENVRSIEHLILLDESLDDETDAPELTGRARSMDETALIVYTSGTTGAPKGVMVTFGNLIFQVGSLHHRLPIGPADVFLSMLPLNHLLEMTGGLFSVLLGGGEVCYGNTLLPADTLRIVKERKVTQIVTVPIFLKLLKAEIERASRRGGESSLEGLRCFISGGAALETEVERFFDRMTVPVYQGYGMTECSPVIAVNSPAARKVGSVGRPLDGVEVRIDSGEILTRGPHVMKGYFGQPERTREVIDRSGWLRTGDIGRLDSEGFLHVTGRVKNLIVLGSGMKVQAEEVEMALARAASVKEVCVLATRATEGLRAGTEEVCAIVVPADDILRRFAGREDLAKESIEQEIDDAVSSLSSYKRPSRVVVHPGPLPRGASHKIKREEVLDWLGRSGRPSPESRA